MWDAVCKHIVLVEKHVHMCVSEVVSVSLHYTIGHKHRAIAVSLPAGCTSALLLKKFHMASENFKA